MKVEQKTYEWTRKDKTFYALSMVPFLIVFVGTAYLLSTYSIYLTILLVGMYLLTNVFKPGVVWAVLIRGHIVRHFAGYI